MERNRGGRPRHPDVLTPAEWRVLEALREGGTNAEIAARLGVSPNTVRYHVSNMLAKLELRDRRALAAWRPDGERRGASGWLGLLLRPAIGIGATAGIAVVVVVFAVIIGGSRDDAAPTDGAVTVSPAPDVNIEGCSGVAVTNPGMNTELVADCEALLGLRDTIRGTRTLDWTGSKAMSEWTGVTVSGTPQRVTAIDLSDLGLDGELSGLLGNLTGLTTLDLSGNPLTGMLPSKLALLTSLTTLSISGTDFEGCAPEQLRDVATNDVTHDDCGEAGRLPVGPIPAGSYRIDRPGRSGALIVDWPADSGLELAYTERSHRTEGEAKETGDFGLIFINAEETMGFAIDVHMATEWSRRFEEGFTHVGTATGYTRAEYEALLDRIVESMWVKDE